MQSTSSHGEVRLVGGVEEKRDEFALICEGGRYRLERLESVVTGLKPGSPRAAPARSPRAAAPARSPSGDEAVDESMLFGDDDDDDGAPAPTSASSSRSASAGGIQLQTQGGADDSESESLSDSA